MDWADKSRMPVDERKVRDMLRNQHIVRNKITNEVSNYELEEKNPTLEHGLLQYVNDAAHGDLKDLITDVGINEDSIPFVNFQAEDAVNGNMMYESDHQFKYLANALFCPLDMTDHEEAFVGWNELPIDVPITSTSWLTPIMPEAYPQTDCLVEEDVYEKRPVTGTGPTMFAINEARAADVEEEEAPGEYGIEEEDEYGDDYGEEGEEGEEGGEEADYGDYGEEEEEAVWPPKESHPTKEPADRLFLGQEKLRDRYNNNEVDTFMRLLAVKPNLQWEDQSTHHHKLGVHTYEDIAQELDQSFHTLSEVERVHADRLAAKEFRQGHEVKFALGRKRPTERTFRF